MRDRIHTSRASRALPGMDDRRQFFGQRNFLSLHDALVQLLCYGFVDRLSLLLSGLVTFLRLFLYLLGNRRLLSRPDDPVCGGENRLRIAHRKVPPVAVWVMGIASACGYVFCFKCSKLLRSDSLGE